MIAFLLRNLRTVLDSCELSKHSLIVRDMKENPQKKPLKKDKCQVEPNIWYPTSHCNGFSMTPKSKVLYDKFLREFLGFGVMYKDAACHQEDGLLASSLKGQTDKNLLGDI